MNEKQVNMLASLTGFQCGWRVDALVLRSEEFVARSAFAHLEATKILELVER